MDAAVDILSLETVIHIDSETEVKSKDVFTDRYRQRIYRN